MNQAQTNNAVYLDFAAATPVRPEVLAAMRPYYSQQFYNPSATYQAAREVRKSLEAARRQVAGVLGARPTNIVFTAGGTEANNLAIQGVMDRYPDGNVLVSAVEHESVLAPAASYDCRIVPVDSAGLVDLDALESQIDDRTVLVSIMYANNEVGTIQPIRKIAEVLARIRANRDKGYPLYFHTDACQAGAYLDLHVSRLGVDMLTLNGGKIYGPKQSGMLYVHHNVTLQPQILGGGQEYGIRSGTENVAQVVGLALALELAQALRHDEGRRLEQLRDQLLDQLAVNFPNSIINGSRKLRLPNNVHVTFPGVDNETLLMQLDEVGIQASAGSACSASSEEPSHVLSAMGISETAAQSSLRFSLGASTTKEDVDQVVVALKSLLL